MIKNYILYAFVIFIPPWSHLDLSPSAFWPGINLKSSKKYWKSVSKHLYRELKLVIHKSNGHVLYPFAFDNPKFSFIYLLGS